MVDQGGTEEDDVASLGGSEGVPALDVGEGVQKAAEKGEDGKEPGLLDVTFV